LLLSNFAEAA